MLLGNFQFGQYTLCFKIRPLWRKYHGFLIGVIIYSLSYFYFIGITPWVACIMCPFCVSFDSGNCFDTDFAVNPVHVS